MAPIKILYFHHGNAEGGAPRSLAFLIANLNKEVYEPYIVCCKDEERNRKLFESVGAKVYFCEKMGPWHGSTVSGMSVNLAYSNLKKALPTYLGMSQVLKEVNPDIVHLNSTCLFLVGRAVKRYNKEVPVICHVREPLLSGFWGDILRWGNKKVDKFIAIQKYDADSLGKNYENIEIIYNFVDFSVYNSNVESRCLRDELNIEEDAKILLYLARISPENGALEMLNAMLPLLKRRKDVHVCVVGAHGEPMSEYQRNVFEVAKECSDRIHILPFRTDVPKVIASCDVMVVPFQTPHSARSVIEASAMGIPSIGSNIGCVQEIINDGETGFLFEQRDFSDFVEKCERILSNNELRETMGKKAELYAKEFFDAEKNSRKVCNIYSNLLQLEASV